MGLVRSPVLSTLPGSILTEDKRSSRCLGTARPQAGGNELVNGIQRRMVLALVALTALAVHSQRLSASCFFPGNPVARDVEVLGCIDSQAYFDSHYSQLHPPPPESGSSTGTGRVLPDPKKVFEGQLANQPGVVLRVKVLRLREYTEPGQKSEHYQWAGPWREKEATEETLYLRRKTASCGSVEAGAKVVLIRAPQCCDTGYFGEIGCHLKLGMVQELPDDLTSTR
jgi:hypothetical protein